MKHISIRRLDLSSPLSRLGFVGAALLGAALTTALTGCSEHSAPSPIGTASASEGAKKDSLTLDPSQLRYVKIEEVKASDAAPSVVFTGRITFDEDHTQRVSTPIDGRATGLLVKPGDIVKPGQSLIELSSPQVGVLQAEAQKAQQDLQLAQRTADRVHKLKTDGAVSEKDVAQAEADLQKAKSDVGRTGAQLRSIGISASDPTVAVAIHAQIGGTVVERNVLLGQEVRADATTPLITVTNLGAVWAVADVYEQDLALISTGAKVAIDVPAYPNVAFEGTVAHLADVVDPNSRTVKLRCLVPNPEGKLKPEMFANIHLAETGGKGVLMVSSRAVLNDGAKTQVVVAVDNTFQLRQVVVGPETDGKVRIVSGIKPGERIVTDGALFVKQALDRS